MDGILDTFQLIVGNVTAMFIYDWLKEYFNKRTTKRTKKCK